MDSVPPFLGIDFGTGYSSMAWFNPKTGQSEILENSDGETKTRSMAYFDGDGSVHVGKMAENVLEDGDSDQHSQVIASVKRDLAKSILYDVGSRRVSPVNVVAEILHKLRNDAEGLHFHAPISHVVITHPVAFDQLEKDKLHEAAQSAGFENIELLEEPVAAAMAFGNAGIEVGKYVLVYDLGAGTFDLAVVEWDEKRRVFSPAFPPLGLRIGGDDFDRCLYGYFAEQAEVTGRRFTLGDQSELRCLELCRKRKEQLTTYGNATFSSLLGDGRPWKHSVSRDKFESLIELQIAHTVAETRKLMADAKTHECPIDTVLLIGGSSRIPLVRELISRECKIEPKLWNKQDVAVALGAAFLGHLLWGANSLTTQYKGAVQQLKAAGQLEQSTVEALDDYRQKLCLSIQQVEEIEEEVLSGITVKQAWSQVQLQHKRGLYREVLKRIIYPSGVVTEANVSQLTEYATLLELDSADADAVERELLGDNKETVAAEQRQFNVALDPMWPILSKPHTNTRIKSSSGKAEEERKEKYRRIVQSRRDEATPWTAADGRQLHAIARLLRLDKESWVEIERQVLGGKSAEEVRQLAEIAIQGTCCHCGTSTYLYCSWNGHVGCTLCGSSNVAEIDTAYIRCPACKKTNAIPVANVGSNTRCMHCNNSILSSEVELVSWGTRTHDSSSAAKAEPSDNSFNAGNVLKFAGLAYLTLRRLGILP